MEMIRFGRTEERVPRIGFGTWSHGGPKTVGKRSVGWGGQDDARATASLVAAYEAGLTHWDTADVYGDGHSEELIGSLWDRVPRSQIFLATKVGWDPGGYGHSYHPDLMRRNLERSLRLLRTEAVDLYYLHHCDFGRDGEHFDGAIEMMRRFREEGKIRFVGLSDWDSKKILLYVDRADPDVIQPYRNLLADDYEESGLKAWVEEHDAGVAFFSPLKHGLLLGKHDKPPTFERGDFRSQIPEFRDRALIARLGDCRREIESRFAGHPQPVLHAIIGALLAGSPTACALLGQRDPRHTEAATALTGPIEPADAAWVRALYRG